MSEESKPVSFNILDKQYQVACKPSEQDQLLATVQYLDRKMREIRDSGKVVGAERIAVMAALNVTHDLLQTQQHERTDEAASNRIRSMQQRLDTVLSALGNPAA